MRRGTPLAKRANRERQWPEPRRLDRIASDSPDNIAMRIASLISSATEMLFGLGLADEIVAVSHECDYPPPANEKPRDDAYEHRGRRSQRLDRPTSEGT
jgi:hypothetical protein